MSRCDEILAQISALPWDQKVRQDNQAGDLGEYLTGNAQAIGELGQFMAALEGGLTPTRLAALYRWLKHHEVDEIEMVGWKDKFILNHSWVSEGASGILTAQGEQPPASGWTQAQIDQADADMRLVEQAWFERGATAPVAVVFFGGQYTNELNGDIVPSTPDSQFYWDGTPDLLALPPKERNAACQKDTDESDQMRDGACAVEEAREWDGPFAVSVSMAWPSELLVSLRRELQLEMALGVGAGRGPGPRL